MGGRRLSQRNARRAGRPARLGAGLALAALLGACSTPVTRVVLLPQADGRPSAVVVRTRNGEQVLNAPFQRATVANRRSAPTLDQIAAPDVRREHAPLFDLAPPPPELFTLYFQLDTTVLTPRSQRLLPRVLAAAAARPHVDVLVIGHTDTLASEAHNEALSRLRAERIRQALADHGIPPERIEAAGRGERDLAVSTPDEALEGRNRRATVELR